MYAVDLPLIDWDNFSVDDVRTGATSRVTGHFSVFRDISITDPMTWLRAWHDHNMAQLRTLQLPSEVQQGVIQWLFTGQHSPTNQALIERLDEYRARPGLAVGELKVMIVEAIILRKVGGGLFAPPLIRGSRLVVGGGRASGFPRLKEGDVSLNKLPSAKPDVVGDIRAINPRDTLGWVREAAFAVEPAMSNRE